MASNFKGMSKQKVSIKKPDSERFFTAAPGDYLGDINRSKFIEMEDGRKYAILEIKVTESSNPKIKVGDIREYWRDFKYKDSAYKELMTCVCSAMDLDPTDYSFADEDFDTFFPEGDGENPMIGKTIRFNVWCKEGSTFPKFKFYAK